eukprot:1159813-Pelagomonas_calceolata.AAC.18
MTHGSTKCVWQKGVHKTQQNGPKGPETGTTGATHSRGPRVPWKCHTERTFIPQCAADEGQGLLQGQVATGISYGCLQMLCTAHQACLQGGEAVPGTSSALDGWFFVTVLAIASVMRPLPLLCLWPGRAERVMLMTSRIWLKSNASLYSAYFLCPLVACSWHEPSPLRPEWLHVEREHWALNLARAALCMAPGVELRMSRFQNDVSACRTIRVRE